MDRVGEHIYADWLHRDDIAVKIVMGITYGTIPFLFHNAIASLKVKAFLHLDFIQCSKQREYIL